MRGFEPTGTTACRCGGIGGGGLAGPAPPAPPGYAMAINILCWVLHQSNVASYSLGPTNHSLLHSNSATSADKFKNFTTTPQTTKIGFQIDNVTMTGRIFLFIGF